MVDALVDYNLGYTVLIGKIKIATYIHYALRVYSELHCTEKKMLKSGNVITSKKEVRYNGTCLQI